MGGRPALEDVLKAEDSDPDPMAIGCDGMLRKDTKKVLLRFAENRPLRDNTAQLLEWACQGLRAEGKTRLLAIWEDAPWHASKMALHRLQKHNHRVRRAGGAEVLHFGLPAGSPWRNDMEPSYRHAKKVMVEPGRKLSAQETVDRVCQHVGCPLLPYLRGVETTAG